MRPPALLSPPAFGRGPALSDAAKALAPHWGALLALALLLTAGLAVLDDYGVTGDEAAQRRNLRDNLRHVAGDANALPSGVDRFFGMGFEAPLLLAENALGLDGTRAVFLVRHLNVHLFFLVGGLFAYMLAFRLLRNRPLAVLALLTFLLHPRLYAHSFFNSKDVPFLVLFVIALYLVHRAFERDRVAAFVLLGAAVGALVHLRVMGVVLLTAVPAMRALDFAWAQGWAERKRVLLTTSAFALSGALTVYALLPYLWPDPVGRAVEWLAALSDHPALHYELFRGTIRRSMDLPADYLPMWFSITAPPFALILGIIGAASALIEAAKSPGAALRNGRPRFALALTACFALPVLAVTLLGSNVFNGWRHLYFLWAPFALLAAFGLRQLVFAIRRPQLRIYVYGAAGAGLAASAVSMALIHPNEPVYFNLLADRATPERLRTQFVMDYWSHPVRQALESLLAEGRTAEVNVGGYHNWHTLEENAGILPRSMRERISLRLSPDALVIRDVSESRFDFAQSALKVYGNTITTIERKDDLRAAYAEAASGELILDDVFDVYRLDGALAFVKEPCAPSFVRETLFRLRMTPVNPDDLPPWLREDGFAAASFDFPGYGALFDGKCVARYPLPDYPIAEIRIRWDQAFLGEDEARAAMRQAVESGRLAAHSAYDLHLAGETLAYIQEPCDAAATEGRFFLHVFPERLDDLPAERREYGFANFGFDFHANGALLANACAAFAQLPPYPIARVRTGQYAPGDGEVWSAEFPFRE